MKRTQRGMTLIGFLISLAVAGVFIYMGMKVIPMYSEYYSVKQALAGLAEEPGITEESPAEIEDLFFKRLYISYANTVKSKHFKITRNDAGYHLVVDYEVRRPLVANLDIVGNFHAEQDLSRRAGR